MLTIHPDIPTIDLIEEAYSSLESFNLTADGIDYGHGIKCLAFESDSLIPDYAITDRKDLKVVTDELKDNIKLGYTEDIDSIDYVTKSLATYVLDNEHPTLKGLRMSDVIFALKQDSAGYLGIYYDRKMTESQRDFIWKNYGIEVEIDGVPPIPDESLSGDWI